MKKTITYNINPVNTGKNGTKSIPLSCLSASLLICLSVLALSVTAHAAPPFSMQDKPVYAGGEVILESLTYAVNDADKNVTSYAYPILGLGVLYDMYYLRLGVSYTATGDRGQITSDDDSIDGDAIDDTYSFLNITALGKYPIQAGRIEVWPAAGVQYSLNLVAEDEDGNEMEDAELSDAYLMLGGGFDYNIDNKLVLSPGLLFGLNLTPETVSDPPSNHDYFGYIVDLRVVVGYRL